MEMTVTREPGYLLAKISGPLDESARTPFREQLHPAVGDSGTQVVLDLSSVTRINSPGIGNLVALVADANTNGSRVVFCAPSPFVAGVLSVTKLDSYFEITPTLAEAIARVTA